MRTFFVGRHQKTRSSWCHDWVHQLLKDPEAKTSTTAAVWSQSRATKVIHLSGCRSDLRNRFHSEVQFYGCLCPKKTYPYRLYMHRCWLKVETWWHLWKQLPLSPVSIELVMQLQGKWLTCLPRNHIPGCQRCQQGCGSSAKSRFNIVQLWFKQDLRPIAKSKLLMVHDDSIPLSGVPRTPRSL